MTYVSLHSKIQFKPHLAFKIERHQQLNHQTMIDKLESLKAQFDMILIEGAGGIAVPIYEYSDHFI